MTRIYYPKFREMEIIKMNKTELVEAIASSTELTKTDVDKVVTALVEVVTDALAKGDKVSLKGFGNFEVRTRSERTGRNPRTGETMTIAAPLQLLLSSSSTSCLLQEEKL